MDSYKTIKSLSEGQYSEKRSKFLASAHPVQNVDEVKDILAEYRKKYYDARHVCYAYSILPDLERANDDGEPSSTAGKPILGQIHSHELRNILIIVVRYYGGVNLGTSGLIVAYRTAAAEAIGNAEIITRTIDEDLDITFDFAKMNNVMKVVKDMNPKIIAQGYENNLCTMTLRIRKDLMPQLKDRLTKI